MRDSNSNATKQKSNIQCLEVLISSSYIVEKQNNLFWTLSVYSLENQPVKKNLAIHNSQIFHFMVYDWKRTIRQLLDDHQVPYSIIRLFSPDSVYRDTSSDVVDTPMNEADVLAAIDKMPAAGLDANTTPTVSPKVFRREKADLMH